MLNGVIGILVLATSSLASAAVAPSAPCSSRALTVSAPSSRKFRSRVEPVAPITPGAGCGGAGACRYSSGGASFWELVARGEKAGSYIQRHAYDAARSETPMMERTVPRAVMPPAEMELLILDMRSELVPEVDTPDLRARPARYHGLLPRAIAFARARTRTAHESRGCTQSTRGSHTSRLPVGIGRREGRNNLTY